MPSKPNSEANEPKSWAEALNRYTTEKHTAPTYPESSIQDARQRRRYRDARYTKEIRDVNTVLQTYCDPKKEEIMREKEIKEKQKQRQQAVLRSESTRIAAHDWNIVTNTEPQGKKPNIEEGLISMQKKKRVAHRAILTRDYNIVNNTAKADAPPPVISKPKLNRQIVEARDYSIISNQYRENHTSRTRADEEATRQRLVQSYWATNHYDPVRVTFVHPEEEKRFQEARLAQQSQHGHTILSRLPTCIKASEGMLYNITTGEVRDAPQLAQRETQAQASLEKKRTQWKIDRQIRQRDVVIEDHAQTISAHRVHPDRFRVQQQRGYDIITGKAAPSTSTSDSASSTSTSTSSTIASTT